MQKKKKRGKEKKGSTAERTQLCGQAKAQFDASGQGKKKLSDYSRDRNEGTRAVHRIEEGPLGGPGSDFLRFAAREGAREKWKGNEWDNKK